MKRTQSLPLDPAEFRRSLTSSTADFGLQRLAEIDQVQSASDDYGHETSSSSSYDGRVPLYARGGDDDYDSDFEPDDIQDLLCSSELSQD